MPNIQGNVNDHISRLLKVCQGSTHGNFKIISSRSTVRVQTRIRVWKCDMKHVLSHFDITLDYNIFGLAFWGTTASHGN